MLALQPPGHQHDLDIGTAGPAAALTLVIVGAVVIAAYAFLTPFLSEAEWWLRPATTVAAVGFVAGNLWLGAPRLAVAGTLVAAAPVIPVLIDTRRHGPVLRRTHLIARRVAPFVVAATTAASLVLVISAQLPGASPDGRTTLRQCGVLVAAVAIIWCALRFPARARVRVAVGAQSAGLGLVLLLGVAQTIMVVPGAPIPGVPLVGATTRAAERVLVVPQRPGRNLVQLDERVDAVGLDRDALVPTAPRPGTSGTWATVELPRGRSTLWIRRGERLTSVPLDTGTTGPASGQFAGPDGPECAQAVAGVVLAGGAYADIPCPASTLSPADVPALRLVVTFLAARGVDGITLATDTSPRSVAAEKVVRAAAAAAHIDVSSSTQEQPSYRPLVVVTGWGAADRVLRAVAESRLEAEGTYLAPWLLTTSLLRVPAGQLFALPYSPADELPLRYLDELVTRLPAATPSASGYLAWLTGRNSRPSGSYRMYTASTVDLARFSGGQHVHPRPGWLPGGAIVPVTDPR